jgi:hypothetical protein
MVINKFGARVVGVSERYISMVAQKGYVKLTPYRLLV